MLEIAKKLNSKFLFVSSSHVYGPPQELPIAEEHNTNPNNIYGKTKLEAEVLCHNYFQSYDLNITILRLFSVYGPNSPQHLVTNRIISQLLSSNKIKLGNLNTKRDFIYVKDVVKAIEICINNINGFNIFNVGSEKSYSASDICNYLKNISNKNFSVQSDKSKIRKNDPKELISNCAKLKKLNWKPEMDIQEGLLRTFDWFQSRMNS